MKNEKKLNAAQKTAIEYIEGPLLIVAGAGTGKTTVITKKIAYLLQNKLAKPEEILALTFTDKSAAEMQERVDDAIDIGYSDLQISTFHAFCQKILESHALDIGLSNQFKLLTPTAAWLLIQKNFQKFNLDYYRPLGNPYRHIHELLKHFSKCKDELISPEQYLDYAKGLNTESGEHDIEEIKRLTEIATAYGVYNQILHDTSAFDFGDLIYNCNQIFIKRPTILKKYQNKYKYILVDEFQDVNWSQYNLLKLLSAGTSQLTVVGDDDQSIYAFRGASVSNILHFKDDFPKAKEIVLNENYRSFQEILDISYKSIVNNNPDRLEIKLNIEKKLKSTRVESTQKKKDKIRVCHIHSTTLENEVDDVIKEIVRLKKIDKTATWDDFAILVRANNHADPFINQLEKIGLPFEFLASSGLYRQPIVLDSLNYFRVLDDVRDSAAMYRVLSMPFLGFSVNDLQKITYNAKKKAISYYNAMKQGVTLDLSEKGQKICDNLISLIHEGMQIARNSKPSVILYNFLEKSGYLSYLTREEESGNLDSIRQIYHIKQFFDYLNEYETITRDHGLSGFLENFELISEAGDQGGLFEPSDTPDSINILTVHAAKGLEFKYVFVVNLVEDRFPSRRRGEAIEIPTKLIKEKLPEGDHHIEEERRLFYVAMTRAKDRLYLTSASDYGGERRKKISRFLNELGYSVSDSDKDTGTLKKIEKKNEEKGEFVFELPKAFSFSQIRAYETCPFQYKLAHILRIPTRGSASFSFGQSIHGTLQNFYEKVLELNSIQQSSLFEKPVVSEKITGIKVPSLDELMQMYEAAWQDDWYKDEYQKADYHKKGKEILNIFYKSQENNWTIPEKLESWFKIKIGDYFLHGRIDRVDKLVDGTLEIIDYKTGNSKEKLSTEDKEQLFIYQIAVEQLAEYKILGAPSKLTYYYINDDLHTSFIGERKDLEKLQSKLLSTMDQIYKKDFTATPNQFACKFCDFKDICEYRV
ncbi:MAG: ATP-dependent DNA helicase [Candidatus Magasanikbacteria bacterium]